MKKIYCHCAYAKIIDKDLKESVLKRCVESGEDIIYLPDICEMAARKDPELAEIFQGQIKLAACYDRAVKWLCHSGGVEVKSENMKILNMRELTADEVCNQFLGENL